MLEKGRRILITGANGNIGRRLAAALAGDYSVRALVRSERARQQLDSDPESGSKLDVVVGDYADAQVLARAVADCDAVVHLVGIIKESKSNSFAQAHVATTQTLVDAANQAGVTRVVYLSIAGAALNSTNACLRSKAEAEQILQQGQPSAEILRVPMVLGEGDYASAALFGRARKPWSVALRAGSLEQPIYLGDVVAAIVAGLERDDGADRLLELAGPESLPRRQLIARAAQVLGTESKVISLPVELGMLAAWVFETFMAQPPITRAMLGVLDHDDAMDPLPAQQALGIQLTPLDDALRHCAGAIKARS